MNINDFKWIEKRFGTRFAKILKGLGFSDKNTEDIKVADANGNVKTLVTDSNFSSLLAKNGIIEVKWQELKDKRDNGELIPGSLYRITDYQCTTTQENTRSAGHQFDIVLLALSEDKLAEEGWAMMHDGVDMFDDYDIYTVTLNDGVSKEYYLKIIEIPDESDPDNPYLNTRIVDVKTFRGDEIPNSQIERYGFIIDDENKTATNAYISSIQFEELLTVEYPYNYFQNSNLSAWKVWYCLDNDTSRFAWADEGSVIPGELISVTFDETNPKTGTPTSTIIHKSDGDYIQLTGTGPGPTYYYKQGIIVGDYGVFIGNGNPTDPAMTNSFIITSINTTEPTIIPEGKGVIYRLIDEWNNDVPYDFKNIQFIRPMTDGNYDESGTDTWCYTFSLINAEGGEGVMDASIRDSAWNNYISAIIDGIRYLPDNSFVGGDIKYNNYLYDCGNITLNNPFSVSLYNTYAKNPDQVNNSSIYIGDKKVLTEE